MPITLKEILVFPVKSFRGISLESARVTRRGIAFDREWMVMDAAKGVQLTQRELPRMALIATELTPGSMRIRIPNGETFEFPFDDLTGEARKATVWGSPCETLDCGDAVARSLDAFLEAGGSHQCRLVRMKPDSLRAKPTGGGSVALVDAFSFHGVSTASLDDLNARLATPLGMDRFRPNFVYEGCAAYDEDAWKRFRIGEVNFKTDYKCIRCAMTMVEQSTGEAAGPEPLATLAQYRKMGQKVIFGSYFSHENEGTLRRGDAVEILERG